MTEPTAMPAMAPVLSERALVTGAAVAAAVEAELDVTVWVAEFVCADAEGEGDVKIDEETKSD